MEPTGHVIQRPRWEIVVVIVAALYAIATMGNMLNTAWTSFNGVVDLHSYWYAAHFVRQGQDPYLAFWEDTRLTGPFTYLDGVVVNGDPAQGDLQRTPANTALFLLLVTPLAWLSWPTAKLCWLILNIILFIAAPLLTLKWAAQSGLRLTGLQQAALLVMFYSNTSPRYLVGTGQTTLICYIALVLALLYPRWATLGFGLAISKYSIAFPLGFVYLYQRRWGVLLGAAALQVAGYIIIATIAGSSVIESTIASLRIGWGHSNALGINLASVFPGVWGVRPYVVAVLAVLVGVGLGYRPVRQALQGRSVQRYVIIALALLGAALAVYHRLYDGILLFPTFVYLMAQSATRVWLRAFLIIATTIMALPVPLYEWTFGPGWLRIINAIWTLVLTSTFLLGVYFWNTQRKEYAGAGSSISIV